MDQTHELRLLRTPFHTKEEAPIQGAFVPDAEGVLEVHDEFVDGPDE